jgi:hypothetical protein
VVVGVDQPRRHEAPAGVDGPQRGGPGVRRSTERADQAVADRHPAARDLAAAVVDRGDELGVGDQQVGSRWGLHTGILPT